MNSPPSIQIYEIWWNMKHTCPDKGVSPHESSYTWVNKEQWCHSIRTFPVFIKSTYLVPPSFWWGGGIDLYIYKINLINTLDPCSWSIWNVITNDISSYKYFCLTVSFPFWMINFSLITNHKWSFIYFCLFYSLYKCMNQNCHAKILMKWKKYIFVRPKRKGELFLWIAGMPQSWHIHINYINFYWQVT